MNWTAVIEILLGGMSPERFVACYFAMAAGALVYFTLDVRHSTRHNRDTPARFSWRFMVLDNVPRMIGVVLAMAITVILYEDMFGVPINIKLAITSGLGIDALIGTLLKTGKERGPLKRQRDKLTRTINARGSG